MFKTLVRNTVSNSGSTVLKILINFWLTPFLIVHLGRGLYGVWVLLLSFSVSGTLSLLSLGIQSALIKHVAEYHTLRKWRALNELVSGTLYVYAGMGLLGAVGIAVFARYYFAHFFVLDPADIPVAKSMLYVMAVQVAFELPGLCFDGILGGLQRYDVLAALDVFKSGLLAGLFIAALATSHTVFSLSIITLVVTLLYTAALAGCSVYFLPELRLVLRINRRDLVNVADMTKDLLILRLNGVIYNNMDKMIIGAILSAGFVTDYDIGNRIHSMALMVMGLSGTVVIPATSAALARSEHEGIRTLFLKGTKYAIAMTLPVICALFVLSPDLIQYWISPQYRSSSAFARLFLVYLFFWVFTAIGWNMLIGIKQTKPIVRIQVISIAINLSLSFVLSHYYGVSGVIYGTIVGNAVAFIPYMRLMMRNFDVNMREMLGDVFLKTYPQAVVSTAGLLLLMRFWHAHSIHDVIVQAILSVALYALLFLMTGVNARERMRFRSIVSQHIFRMRDAEAVQQP